MEFNVVLDFCLRLLSPGRGCIAYGNGIIIHRGKEDVSIWHGEVNFPLIFFLCLLLLLDERELGGRCLVIA